MDWLEEQVEKTRAGIRNLSFRKAMLAYILILAAVVWGMSYLTIALCRHWEMGIWAESGEAQELKNTIYYQKGPLQNYTYTFARESDNTILVCLDILRVWCPFFYAFAGMVLTIFLFYRRRLKQPLLILEESVERIRKNDLDFHVTYDCADELGKLCDSVEMMRQELIRNKEEMWRLIERQKELNAAFAHDLRTPLTVLRGYTDFLARYAPEGKIGQEKLQSTLTLFAEHLKRLEDYSRTMKGIRSIEEVPFSPERISYQSMRKKTEEVIFALNQVQDIRILYTENCTDTFIWADDSIIMEVLENMLSNAIRYATKSIKVMIDYEAEQSMLFLTVRDDGPGFSEEQRKNALRPYYKEYHADNPDGHFGIGLHICRELCKRHGGTLNIANSLQGGAIVTTSFLTEIPSNRNISDNLNDS